jgi:hypothetical protein
MQFSSHLNTLRLNDIEIGLICSIVLTSLNNSYLDELIDYESRSTVNTINKELFEALKFEISNRFDTTNQNEQSIQHSAYQKNNQLEQQDNECIRHLLTNINNLLEKLHLIGDLHLKQLTYFKLNKHRMKLPHLLSEIFEIPNGAVMLHSEN